LIILFLISVTKAKRNVSFYVYLYVLIKAKENWGKDEAGGNDF